MGRSALAFGLAMAASSTVGAGNVLKNGINSAMGARLGSSVLGTCVGVWCALAVNLALLASGVGHGAQTPPLREVLPSLRPWMALGGVLGGISVALQVKSALRGALHQHARARARGGGGEERQSTAATRWQLGRQLVAGSSLSRARPPPQTFLIAPIGAVLLHVLQLSTEMLVALLADAGGCLGLEKHPFTALRIAGVLTSVLGAVATVVDFSAREEAAGPGAARGPDATGLALVGYCALAIFVGCLRDVQTVRGPPRPPPPPTPSGLDLSPTCVPKVRHSCV
jgi:uncharacterized membrane protein YdcZ (DUF606 family)